MRILTLGFGMTPLFLEHLVKKVHREKKDINFSVILSSSHHLELMRDIFNDENILCIDKKLSDYRDIKVELKNLSNYPDNIFKNIESQKLTLKNRKSNYQLKIAYSVYIILKSFIKKINPDFILYFQPPENMDSMILGGLAKELSIPLAIPHHTRHLGLYFFSFHRNEILPKNIKIKKSDFEQASRFHKSFLEGQTSATVVLSDNGIFFNHIPYKKKSKFIRLFESIKRFKNHTRSREINTIKVSILNSWFPFWRDTIRAIRVHLNKKIYNCGSVEELPQKFIFFPLQYSPESSINIPNPFFIDQLRVIDAIRMSMPSNYLLVVKEHPSCITVRPRTFMKSLLKKAGVIIAKFDLETQLLIKKSKLTISVTGTPSLEAFLYGKPSLVLGPTFFSNFIGGVCEIDKLSEIIKNKLGSQIKEKQILKCLAEVFAVSSNFIARTPGEGKDLMMTYENLDAFWNAFIEHTKRLN